MDLAAGTVIHRIAGLREPQGIGYAPAADVIAIASAGDGSVRLYRGQDFPRSGRSISATTPTTSGSIASSGNFVVGYGSGGLAVIDPVRRTVVTRVKLPVHPEGFQLDPATHRAFVNLPDAQQIAVMDLATGASVATWRVPGLRANFPMAREQSGAVLASVFRNPARLVLFDSRSGAIQQQLPTCGDSDDVFFDEKRSRITVSCGEGSVEVFQRDASDYRSAARIKTASGARTSLFVADLDRLFVAARAGFFGFGSDAAILVFRPDP